MLVTVAICYDNPSATVACSVLNHAGIPAFVFDRQVAHMTVSLIVALGGLRVMVPAEHAAEARTLLDVPDDLGPNDDGEDCPACGAGCAFRPASILFGLLGWLVAHEIFLVWGRRRICRACGHTWRIERDIGPAKHTNP